MADIQARRKALEEWLELRKRCPWPEQQRYEVLRSVVLFGQSPAERALETGVPCSSLYDRVKRFRQLGMISLFTDVDASDGSGGWTGVSSCALARTRGTVLIRRDRDGRGRIP